MKKQFTFKNALLLSAVFCMGIASNLNAQVTLVKPNASTASYSTISAAYAAIDFTANAGAHIIQLESSYVPASETYPIILGAKTGASATNAITIKPAVNAKIVLGPTNATTVVTPITTTAGTTLTVPDASAIVDGSYAYGVGVSAFQTVTKSGNVLTFSAAIAAATNTTLFFGPKATKTIQFNGASYVTIDGVSRTDAAQGLTIQNPNNIAAQTINFTGVSTNNVVKNCIVKGASVSGTSITDFTGGVIYFDALANNGNTVENNDITDITGNYAPITAVYLGSATTSASDFNTVQNNNIANMFYTSVSPANINNNATIYLTGSANANILNNAIYWTTNPSNLTVDKEYFIIQQSSSTGAQSKIEGNVIGAETVATLTLPGGFYGIYANSAATVKNNTIKNLFIAMGKNSGANKNFYGIYILDVANGLSDLYACSGNTIDNISTTSEQGIGGYGTIGISMNRTASVTSKARKISNNTISNISGYYTTYGQNAIIRGIQTVTASTTGTELWDVVANKLFNFKADNNTSNKNNIILGMDLNVNVGTVEKNLLYNLRTISSDATSYAAGIRMSGGNDAGTYIQNNILALGNTTTTANIVYGIWQNGASATSNKIYIYHNSVYIGGAATAGAVNSYAFYRTGTVPTIDVRNNIFANQRTGGTGNHFALSVAAASDLGTSDFNIYQFTGKFGAIGTGGTTTYADLGAWKTASSKDASSQVADPKFVGATGTTPDMHLSSGSPADNNTLAAVLVSDDFYGSTRSTLSPTDIGAVAYNGPNAVETTKNTMQNIYTTSNSIVVSSTNGQNISIYNMTGQLVKTVLLTSNKVSIPASKGFYIVSVGKERTKVLVN